MGERGDPVTRYAALLRAVNVGGRKLPMTDLRQLVEEAGGRDIRTYLQSGNVVFTGTTQVAAKLQRTLRTRLSFEVPVVIRTGAQLADLAAAKPYAAGGSKVSVTFLAAPLRREAVDAIDPAAYAPDEFVARTEEIFLHTPNGYGRTKLNNAFWERRLGVAATTRNWNTVIALSEMTA